MERVLNDDGTFGMVSGSKDDGKAMAELLIMEKDKNAALAFDLRELKKQYDELDLKYIKLVEKFDNLASKNLKSAEKTDPVKKAKK